MTSLREQIEALPTNFRPTIDNPAVPRRRVLDIIDQHECVPPVRIAPALRIPDRDALKGALKEANDTDPWVGVTIDGWFDIYTDRVLAALREQADDHPA